MEHFAFPGNIEFAADDQRISCIIHERPICLFIHETMFTIGESRAISHSDDTEKQAQVAGNPRFSTETALENAEQNSSRAEKTTTTRNRAQSTENIA